MYLKCQHNRATAKPVIKYPRNQWLDYRFIETLTFSLIHSAWDKGLKCTRTFYLAGLGTLRVDAINSKDPMLIAALDRFWQEVDAGLNKAGSTARVLNEMEENIPFIFVDEVDIRDRIETKLRDYVSRSDWKEVNENPRGSSDEEKSASREAVAGPVFKG